MITSIEIECTSFQFKTKKVLNDIFLKLTSESKIGIIGQNGCGKSTFLKLIIGEYTSPNCKVFIDKNYIPSSKRFNYFGYLPQNSFFPRHITVLQALRIFLKKNELTTLLNDELIKPLLRTKISRLSLGEKRLVEVLAIMALERNIYLLDEPFESIDPIWCEEIKGRIIKSNKVFIIVEHLLYQLNDVCKIQYILNNGYLYYRKGNNAKYVV
jgi:ABC-type multidrug transport system ATPase subunit